MISCAFLACPKRGHAEMQKGRFPKNSPEPLLTAIEGGARMLGLGRSKTLYIRALPGRARRAFVRAVPGNVWVRKRNSPRSSLRGWRAISTVPQKIATDRRTLSPAYREAIRRRNGIIVQAIAHERHGGDLRRAFVARLERLGGQIAQGGLVGGEPFVNRLLMAAGAFILAGAAALLERGVQCLEGRGVSHSYAGRSGFGCEVPPRDGIAVNSAGGHSGYGEISGRDSNSHGSDPTGW